VVVAEPVAVAVEVEYDGALEEPVEHGGCDRGVAEDFAPGDDSTVGGERDRGLAVAFGETTWNSAEAASAGSGR
jgi:hypothetical protein